ncbi:MAG: VOC family protein [Thalassobaculales bacterium]
MAITQTIFPAIRYHDAAAAIAWLERAFGFRPHLVVPGPEGGIAHAELRLGDGLVMLGSDREDGFPLRSPRGDAKAGVCIYVVCDEPDALFARARAAGAEVVMAPRDSDHGSRDFVLRDPEGHLWSFGTYRP